MRRALSLIAVIFVGFQCAGLPAVRAEEPAPPAAPKCRAAKWPYARKQSKADLRATFTRSSAATLMRYFIYEVTAPAPDSELAGLLLQHLKATTPSKPLKGFFQFVGWGAELVDQDGVPRKDESVAPRKLEIGDVCVAFAKAKELADEEAKREPQSVKAKTNPKPKTH